MKPHLSRLAALLNAPPHVVVLAPQLATPALAVALEMQAVATPCRVLLVEPLAQQAAALAMAAAGLQGVTIHHGGLAADWTEQQAHFVTHPVPGPFDNCHAGAMPVTTPAVELSTLTTLLRLHAMQADAIFMTPDQWPAVAASFDGTSPTARPTLLAIHRQSRAPLADLAGELRLAGYTVTVDASLLWAWRGPMPLSTHRTVHQLWLGPDPLPAEMVAWQASITTHLPDHQLRLWRDADVQKLAPWLMAPDLCLSQASPLGMRADAIRYNLMRLFGGLYLDTDFQILRPMDALWIPGAVHFGFQQIDQPAIGLLRSPAGHPFWDFLLTRLAAVAPRKPENIWDIVQITGPGFFGRAVHEWTRHNRQTALYDDQGQVAIHWPAAQMVGLLPATVYPYWMGELNPAEFRAANFPRAYAVHHWAASWAKLERGAA